MRDASAHLMAKRDPAPSRHLAGRALTAAEVAAGAGIAGVIAGRVNHWNIPNTPIPIGLAIGAALHAVDIFGYAGKYGAHLANVANGAIASYAFVAGAGVGQSWLASSSGQAPPPLAAGVGCVPNFSRSPMPASQSSVSGALPGYVTRGPAKPLTEAELAAISHSSRR